MKLSSLFGAVCLILPQFVLGLVLLAPPDDHHVDGNHSNVERVELDDSLLQLPWTIPMSNLERAVLALDDQDGTLTKDLMRRQKSHQKKKKTPQHSGRPSESPHLRDPKIQNTPDPALEEKVGQGHADASSSSSTPRQTRGSGSGALSSSVPDHTTDDASEMSRLVDSVSRTLRDRFEPRSDESVSTTSPPPAAYTRSSPSNKQRQLSITGGLSAQGNKESFLQVGYTHFFFRRLGGKPLKRILIQTTELASFVDSCGRGHDLFSCDSKWKGFGGWVLICSDATASRRGSYLGPMKGWGDLAHGRLRLSDSTQGINEPPPQGQQHESSHHHHNMAQIQTATKSSSGDDSAATKARGHGTFDTVIGVREKGGGH
ncbi:hypothetical protein Btru_046918 [Bulinus truncatus]|nr:hypothetical protein Btru_046918 [Bulinus truncatus]